MMHDYFEDAADRLFQQYDKSPYHGCIFRIGTWILCIVFVLIIASLCGCRSVKYIETTKMQHDTITNYQTRIDSLWKTDSVYIEKFIKGDTVNILEREYHMVYRPSYVHDSIYIAHHDTIAAETIKEVPATLSKWQNFRLGLGDLMLVAIFGAIAFGIYKLYLKFKK